MRKMDRGKSSKRLARLWVLLLFFFSGADSNGQTIARTHLFRATDGLKDSYCAAVSVSPRGNLWVKHGDADAVSVFDGYAISKLPTPGRNSFRVYESRSGQLWSLASEGVLVYEEKRWSLYPVPEIRAEIMSDPLRQIRQIPLIPADRNRTLFLLSDRLMEFDLLVGKASLIKSATETRLERFIDMAEASDGSVWISGAKGFLRGGGPTRHLGPGTEWTEHLAPAGLGLENLQRPFQDQEGRVTSVGIGSGLSGDRTIIQLHEGRWDAWPVPAELIRQAWSGWDNTIWAFTMSGLLRLRNGAVAKENLWAGQYRDVALETNGVFWLASSEGLIRFAPLIWRTPPGLEHGKAPLHAFVEDEERNLWAASSAFLQRRGADSWETIPWPREVELAFTPEDSIVPLANRKILVTGLSPLLFDQETGRFAAARHPSGHPIRFLGPFKNQVAVQVLDPNGPAGLQLFDGEAFTAWDLPPPPEGLGELYFVFASSDGAIWLSGMGGLARLHGGAWKMFERQDGYTLDRAFVMLETRDGVWCGGTGQILSFDGKRWQLVRSGLDRVNGMVLARDGRIWVATSTSLQCFFRNGWVDHGLEEGLPSSAVYEVFQDHAGQIWAGTTAGAVQYHPDSDADAPRPIRPRMDESRPLYPDRPVTLFFGGVDKWRHTSSDRLLFSWRLDGGSWSPFTNAYNVTFDRLGSGEHRFSLKAMDRNWNESIEEAFIYFDVIVPWYREWRIITVSFFGLAMAFFFAGLAVNRHRRLLRSYAEVEKIVNLRTHELEKANQELVHSQKMKALGTLSAGIAHDFNNILSIIKGSTQIIETNLDDKEKIRARINRIQTVVDQGSGIVKSMLGLSRVTEKDFAPCDLNEVARETGRILGDRLLQEVDLELELAPNLPPITSSKELLLQMLVNLILNAADAMGGHGRVLVRTGKRGPSAEGLVLAPAKAQAYLFVAVQDYGTGIPPEILPRIFEPFFTTKSMSARRGTGLGLSMVYELAKQLGCGLSVKSTPGQGSVFFIWVPTPGPEPAQITEQGIESKSANDRSAAELE